MKPDGIYDEFREACHRHGTNISTVLKAIGCSTGVTGGWKAGNFPRLDIAMKIADYLEISLDELCYGYRSPSGAILSEEQKEWLEILDNIPADKKLMCKDFLKTHVAIPILQKTGIS